MIVHFYAVKDIDVDFFAPPFMAYSHEEAKQLVRDAIQPDSALSRFPTHYHLYCVGSFAPKEGLMNGRLECLCSINDLTGSRISEEVSE